MKLAVMFCFFVSLVHAAHAEEYKANSAFLIDLNTYAREAPVITLFGEVLVSEPSRPGLPIAILPNGPMISFGGPERYPSANVVEVGEPCPTCEVLTTRYSTNGEWDNLIIVYRQKSLGG